MRRVLLLILTCAFLSVNNLAYADPRSSVTQERFYFFEDVKPGSNVSITDKSTGLSVPLTGEGVRYERGGVEVYTPQLPTGEFEFALGDRLERVVVEGDLVLYSAEGGGGFNFVLVPIILLLLLCLVILKFKPNRYTFSGVLVLLPLVFFLWGLLGKSDTVSLSFNDIDACTKTSTVERCIIPKVAGVERKLGPSAVSDALRPITSDCHSVAHSIGFESFRLDRDYDKARERASGVCAFGIVHGSIEAIATFSDDESMVINSERYCNSLSNELQFACFHAIGHSTIWRVNGDLNRGMVLCEDLVKHDKYECMGSAIMEWSTRLSLAYMLKVEPNVTPVPEEPLEICAEGPMNVSFKNGCFIAMADLYYEDLDKIVSWCASKESVYGVNCFKSVANTYSFYINGGDRSNHTVENFLSFRERVCDKGDSYERRECSEELAASIVNINRDDKPMEMCERYPKDLVEVCFRGVKKGFSDIKSTGQ
ncbi:MAG: hypothetical protein ACKOW9_03030 [Candidatus Paceibacterota bacterium]